MDVTYLDLEKTFDEVTCRGLIYKLEQLGILARISQWIALVKIEKHLSMYKTVISNVSQGSVLALIFVADGSKWTICRCIKRHSNLHYDLDVLVR